MLRGRCSDLLLLLLLLLRLDHRLWLRDRRRAKSCGRRLPRTKTRAPLIEGDGDRRRQKRLTGGRHLELLLLDLGRPLNHCLRRLQVSLRWRLVDRNSLDLILRSVCVHEELELVLHLLLHLLQELLTEKRRLGC